MRTWNADRWLAGAPADVLELLVRPELIREWAPVRFELVSLEGNRLSTGGEAIVAGELAGRRLSFEVRVHEASARRLALCAIGPLRIDVEYRLVSLDCGTELRAAVRVCGEGLRGRLCARAAEGLLAAGALDHALNRLATQLGSARPRAGHPAL